MGKVRAHLFIRGYVQGVNFRYYTRRQALSRGVTGWVRNLWDGRVEAVFEGEQNDVDWMVEWCRAGPPSASVYDVEVEWEKVTGEFEGFDVRTTARGR
jgi:acylphosphatase